MSYEEAEAGEEAGSGGEMGSAEFGVSRGKASGGAGVCSGTEVSMTTGSSGGVATKAGLGDTGSVPPGTAVTTLKAFVGSMIAGSGSRLGLASPSKD